ncbi:MAG: Uma2 family endonuclease [Deltaproteobacteria bacterium]|nr:Uma2 family endonuclease [Deltaproteobacteria bacterium]
MHQIAHHRYTFQEYVELEESSDTKHEFLDGSIFAMAGGTPEHAAMAAFITSRLGSQMQGCRVYSSDLRVRVLATGLATYPDVTVICGPSERDPSSPTHVTNPTVVVEILSNATEDYDRGDKLEHYKLIPSLKAIVLVDHRKPHVEVWTRPSGVWEAQTFVAGTKFHLDAVGAELSVDDVYDAAREA